MRRSQVGARTVNKLVEQRYKAHRDFNGKNPTAEQKETMKAQIVDLAKRADKDRRL